VTAIPPPVPDAERVLSVNVGRPAETVWHGRTVRSAIWKAPVTGPVHVRGVNLVGDAQADRKAHGGPDKALYAYGAEDLCWWSGQLGVELGPGSMGENLTTSDLDLSEAVVGERWEIGSVVLQITQPRIPCYKLGIRMGDDGFPERFAGARRHRVFLRILAEGAFQAGDEIQVVDRPAHGLRAVDVAHIFYDEHHRAGELLSVAELAESWHRWARRVLAPAG
jgi:MOSC domain-containing protein YiiM